MGFKATHKRPSRSKSLPKVSEVRVFESGIVVFGTSVFMCFTAVCSPTPLVLPRAKAKSPCASELAF